MQNLEIETPYRMITAFRPLIEVFFWCAVLWLIPSLYSFLVVRQRTATDTFSAILSLSIAAFIIVFASIV